MKLKALIQIFIISLTISLTAVSVKAQTVTDSYTTMEASQTNPPLLDGTFVVVATGQ